MIHIKDYTMALYNKLNEAEEGNFKITKTIIKKGTGLTTYSPLGFFYFDKFGGDFHSVRLEEDGGVWMSDTPMEQESLRITSVLARGDMLIIGLGLGLLPILIKTHNRLVNTITIIEKNPEVVKLVYDKIKFRKTSVEVCDGEDYLTHTSRKFDFIYVDMWGSIIASLKQIDYWTNLAKRCLRENGEVRCWLQELYDRIKDKLPKEPTAPTKPAGIHDPCLICGKKLRNDYAGLCMDCADELGVSEMFVGK